MASISFWSLILPLVVLLTFTSVEGARNLQQSTLSKVHEVSKIDLPPVAGLPNLPLPLPKPELPPLPNVPIPGVPVNVIPTLPTIPTIPTVPGIPGIPKVPTIPGIPKPELPAVPKP
uniref:Low-temperature inducible protein n=1 Tax=Caragana jubata TaxID=283153 RepID=F1C3E4_9FABA|nr:low-temperature inducible protein [Caragana jubata]